jgi:hypothetical protein
MNKEKVVDMADSGSGSLTGLIETMAAEVGALHTKFCASDDSVLNGMNRVDASAKLTAALGSLAAASSSISMAETSATAAAQGGGGGGAGGEGGQGGSGGRTDADGDPGGRVAVARE